MSNKKIDWSIEIPFIFRVSLVKYPYGLQGNFNIQILFFSFYIGLYYGLGLSVNHHLEKWCYRIRIHLKRVYFAFVIGYFEYSILEWRTNRLYKRLSPEKKKRFIKIIDSILKEKDNE
jgi:hypothetical protein